MQWPISVSSNSHTSLKIYRNIIQYKYWDSINIWNVAFSLLWDHFHGFLFLYEIILYNFLSGQIIFLSVSVGNLDWKLHFHQPATRKLLCYFFLSSNSLLQHFGALCTIDKFFLLRMNLSMDIEKMSQLDLP